MTYSTRSAPALVPGAGAIHNGGSNLSPIGDPVGAVDLALTAVQSLRGSLDVLGQSVDAIIGEAMSLDLMFRATAHTPAHIGDLLLWARNVMAGRSPDFVIGDDYLRRWYVIPRNPWCNVYLHEVRKSDDDRALHDHPWRNTSLILAGEYDEHVPGGIVHRRRAGDVVEREATALHRLAIDPDAPPVITLFITGPKVREWGFDCPNGWVPWQDFTSPTDSSQIGRGCGEA